MSSDLDGLGHLPGTESPGMLTSDVSHGIQ